MKNRDGLENSNHWATPEWLYDQLDAEFHFNFDPCPLHADFDGLAMPWGSCSFVNPPYDRINKPKFIKKAYEEWKLGKTVVMLLPVSTSTKQFHELILPNAEIRFLRGRIKFRGINTLGKYTESGSPKHDRRRDGGEMHPLTRVNPTVSIVPDGNMKGDRDMHKVTADDYPDCLDLDRCCPCRVRGLAL